MYFMKIVAKMKASVLLHMLTILAVGKQEYALCKYLSSKTFSVQFHGTYYHQFYRINRS